MQVNIMRILCKQKIIDPLKRFLKQGLSYKELALSIAIGAWLIISPLVLVLLYGMLKPVLVRINSRPPRLKFIRR
jgi:hypothetical protein